MCNGMAICVNANGDIRCKYVRSHDDTLTGEDGDLWARLEMLLPAWEHPVLDGEGRLDAWKKAGLLDMHGDLKSKLRESVETWIQEHRVPIMEWFLAEPGQFGGKATIKGNQRQNGQTVTGDQYQYGQTVMGHQYQYGQTVEGDIYIDEMVNGPEDVMAHLTAYYAYHESRADSPTLAGLVRWLVSGQVDEPIIKGL